MTLIPLPQYKGDAVYVNPKYIASLRVYNRIDSPEDTCLLHLSNGDYFRLNGTPAEILRLITTLTMKATTS